MKRVTAIVLSIFLLAGLAGCNGTPAFSEMELTEAQSYAYEAIHGYEINRKLSLISAEVLLTEDVTKAIPDNIITKDWEEVQETRAIVLAKYGDLSAQENDEEASKDGKETEIEPSLVMAFFLNEEKETIAEVRVSGVNGSENAAAEGYGVKDYSDVASTFRRQLAEAELSVDDFLAKNSADQALAAFAPKVQALEKTMEKLGTAELARATGNNKICMEYLSRLWNCAILREQLSRAEAMKGMSGKEQYTAQELAESDIELWEQKCSILTEYAAAAKRLADYEGAHAEAIAPLKKALAEFPADSWWDDEAYLKLCLASDECNQYDVLRRQLRIYESSLTTLDDAMKTEDTDYREYIAEKLNTETDAFSDYSNAAKTHVQCVRNQENFLTKNAQQLSAYETAEAAARKAAGAQYEEDIEYIKVQITYEDLIEQRSAHESAVKNSKEAADKIRKEMEEEIAAVEEEEAERQNRVLVAQMQEKLREYLSQEHESVSEYEAGADQWGSLHPDFAAYQNKNLTYIVEHTNYTPKTNSGSGSGSGSGGMKYDPNDENYSSHDYDGDGRLSDQEFQDAFNDYVNDILSQ